MGKTFHWIVLTFVTMCIVIIYGVSVNLLQNTPTYILASPQPKENITMTVIFNQFNFKDAGKSLVDSAADKLRSNHPDHGINIKYIEIPVYNNTRNQILKQ